MRLTTERLHQQREQTLKAKEEALARREKDFELRIEVTKKEIQQREGLKRFSN